MTTALQLITDAAATAGVIDPVDPLANDTAQFILRRFNRMLDSWANERLMIFNTYVDDLALTGGTAAYSTTLLAHGNARQWDSASVRLSNIDYPLQQITITDYRNWITYKPTSAIPTKFAVDTDWPNSTLYFFPTPFGSMTAHMSARQVLSSTLTLQDDLALPPGYDAAIVDNLAVDISPSFGLAPNANLMQSAVEKRAVLKRNNYEPQEAMIAVPIGPRVYNILSGNNGI